ncbi:pyrroline-5-carboxylate reductase [Amphibacillus marinus]|uniref:Pyrroline-5-carboxylate reductase n=1 Tax=Amphibacillus marinus TaxID=872970 RepID=A0A1H8JY28_9BACI|nr:pyrroline-5-carboxylate reductase [Amphibacillus marinus]SEN85602.1 pyrroline-5-carboxylate reductase [Amphibacillus marinus]
MSNEKILIVGAGRMAQAIIKGLKKADFTNVMVANKGNQERLEEVESRFNVDSTTQWQEHVSDQDIVILAMPPEAHEQVLSELAPVMTNQLIITVAAGIDVSYLEKRLPEGTAVAWVMPNTAAAKGESITLFTPGKNVSDEQEYFIEKILFSIGKFKKLNEQQLHALTPITGSAPAFIYRMALTLINKAKETGVSEVVAKQLVAQMIRGSAEMLNSELKCTADLIDEVASPGGVTAAALSVFDQYQFDQMMNDVLTACYERAKQ